MRRKNPKGRLVDGIIVVDKPRGFSSNQILQKIKRLFEAAKAGHTGSLDPLATGVLPICFGNATKMSHYLLNSDKSYVAHVRLGQKTTTGDCEGSVIAELPVTVTRDQLESTLCDFRGEVRQIPSMYSAIKYKGQPLYKLAHQGIEIERLPRNIYIHRLALSSFSGTDFIMEVDCSKGTYIRTLAEDIGDRLGCGAHITNLRRIKAGPYDIESAYTMESLEAAKAKNNYQALDELLQGQDTAVMHWPAVQLGENTSFYLRQGQPVQVPKAPASGWVRLYGVAAGKGSETPEFIGLGEITDDGLVAPRRLISDHSS